MKFGSLGAKIMNSTDFGDRLALNLTRIYRSQTTHPTDLSNPLN